MKSAKAATPTISLDPPFLDLYHEPDSSQALSAGAFLELGLRRARIYQKILALLDTESMDRVLEETFVDLSHDFPLETVEQRVEDRRAHFILRLACGGIGPELGGAFVRCECIIFQARMSAMGPQWQKQFVDKWVSSRFQVKKVPLSEMVLVGSALSASRSSSSSSSSPSSPAAASSSSSSSSSSAAGGAGGEGTIPCWEVPFEDCADLVARRVVRICNGIALVPVTDLLFEPNQHHHRHVHHDAGFASAAYSSDDGSRVVVRYRQNRPSAAFSVLRQHFTKLMRNAVDIAGRARPLFDTDAAIAEGPLRSAVHELEKLVRTPYIGDRSLGRLAWRRSRALGNGGGRLAGSSSPSSSLSTPAVGDAPSFLSQPHPNQQSPSDGGGGAAKATGSSPTTSNRRQTEEDPVAQALQNPGQFEVDINLLRDPQLWRCFPPCMFRLMDHMDRAHHLRYDARVQLMIFLRTVGVPLPDALILLRTEFAKDRGMTTSRYTKKRYEYLVRHIYGRVGRGIPWAPHKCSRIQRSSSSVRGFRQGMEDAGSQVHGCVFSTCKTQESMSALLGAQCGGGHARRRTSKAQETMDIEDGPNAWMSSSGDDDEEEEDNDAADDAGGATAVRRIRAEGREGGRHRTSEATKLLRLAQQNPALACQRHFAMNFDLLPEKNNDDVAGSGPYEEAIRAAGVGVTPAAYFRAAASLLQFRQANDAQGKAATSRNTNDRGGSSGGAPGSKDSHS